MEITSRRRQRAPANYQVPALERGMAVLEYLDQHPAGRTMIETARDLGLSKNAVFRITLTLVRRGYLERDNASKRFRLGHKTLMLGYGALGDGRSLVEQASEQMRALREATGETVCLSVLADREGFVLESVPGKHLFRCAVDPGMRQPVHASASGKAIIAHLPPGELDALLQPLRLVRLTSNTITRKAQLRLELRRVRECGYALDRCEHIDGAMCVAAPIFDRRGSAAASLTVTAPAGRMPRAKLSGLGRMVRQHADEISARLGGPVKAKSS
ncbi:MAG: IclR family transcriptional regulator [Verrucomicrobiae bacterium]|nr:IclR family transcriptional regulator [Verrucomicrobiae bacterium]